MMQLVFKIKDNKIIDYVKKSDGEVPVETRKKYKESKCGWCGKVFTPTHSHNLYCSKQCRYYSDLEHNNQRKIRYRKRFHGMFNDRAILNVGTGGLGQHAKKNFEDEARIIRNEMKKLGLKKEK